MSKNYDSIIEEAGLFIEEMEYDKAYVLLRPLETTDVVDALLLLAWLHITQNIPQANQDKAKTLYSKAKKLGSIVAPHELALIHISEQDFALARKEFLEGAERGYLPSVYRLSRFFLKGIGGEQDRRYGIQLLTFAAEHGHLRARLELLFQTEKGRRKIIRLRDVVPFIQILIKLFMAMRNNGDSEILRR